MRSRAVRAPPGQSNQMSSWQFSSMADRCIADGKKSHRAIRSSIELRDCHLDWQQIVCSLGSGEAECMRDMHCNHFETTGGATQSSRQNRDHQQLDRTKSGQQHCTCFYPLFLDLEWTAAPGKKSTLLGTASLQDHQHWLKAQIFSNITLTQLKSLLAT